MTTDIEIDYQIVSDIRDDEYLPDHAMVENWVSRLLQELHYEQPVQLSIRVVGEQEITQLNEKYRKKNQSTNVLSFPYEPLPGVNVPLLGDVVVCARIVGQQAKQQGKSPDQHWAHMIIHGVLHLLGYDHIKAADADEMEAIEINILSKLGFPNPYGETNTL